VLYLEAEAAGVRSTGIGCFFDDPVHQVFGLGDLAFQSLYHFTVAATSTILASPRCPPTPRLPLLPQSRPASTSPQLIHLLLQIREQRRQLRRRVEIPSRASASAQRAASPRC
jgi:hypothetical protein